LYHPYPLGLEAALPMATLQLVGVLLVAVMSNPIVTVLASSPEATTLGAADSDTNIYVLGEDAPTTELDAQHQGSRNPPTQNLGIQTAQLTYAITKAPGLLTMEAVIADVFNRTQAPSDMCGNGIRQGSEQCDDGNLVDGDGCSKLCQVEGGYACELKLLDDVGDQCYQCQDSDCTVFFFGNSHCLKTTKSNSTQEGHVAPLHIRRISGFCSCAENHCMDIEGAMCRPEKDGWVANVETNVCECGLGYCLMPLAEQVISSPSKYHCQKMKSTMIRNKTTSMCMCAKGTPAVESDDPAEASPEKHPACKVYPSTPVWKMPHQGPIYPEFSCMADPYKKGNNTDVCTNCTASACRMERFGVSGGKTNLNLIQPKQFYCVGATEMEALKMTRKNATDATNGKCECSATECLAPYRDTMKCVPIEGSHPYGGVKLTDGKCGCVAQADTCIMPNSPGGFNSETEGFLCLKLKEGIEKTHYGQHYYRGRNGHCKCLPTHCRADPTPSSVGNFRCIDVATKGAYQLDKEVVAAIQAGTSDVEDVPCQCADGACMLPGDTRETSRCVQCPSAPGECVTRCSAAVPGVDVMSCIKYCSTKHVHLAPGFAVSYGDLFHKTNYDARVVRCFVAKTITCETAPEGKVCTSKVTARAIYDCPGQYSKRTSRKLIDGTETYGFKSVCSSQNYQCQTEKCNSRANPAVCLRGTVLT